MNLEKIFIQSDIFIWKGVNTLNYSLNCDFANSCSYIPHHGMLCIQSVTNRQSPVFKTVKGRKTIMGEYSAVF